MNRRAALLFAALGIAWGIPYLLVKVSVAELSPAAILLVRSFAAAAFLLPLAAARGALRPTLRRWRPIVAYAAVEVVVPWLMIGHAEQRLASSTTGLLIAATPLMGVAVGLLAGRHERMGAAGWGGLLLGFVGVAALVGLDVDTADRGAVLQLLVVVVGYAIGPMILARSLSGESGLAVVGLSFGAAAIGAVGVLAVGGGWPTQVPSMPVVGALAILSSVCTAGAFLLLFALVHEVGAVRSMAVTYLNPAVAIVVGALFLGERITGWTVLGFAFVLVGSVLLARRPASSDGEVVVEVLEGEAELANACSQDHLQSADRDANVCSVDGDGRPDVSARARRGGGRPPHVVASPGGTRAGSGWSRPDRRLFAGRRGAGRPSRHVAGRSPRAQSAAGLGAARSSGGRPELGGTADLPRGHRRGT